MGRSRRGGGGMGRRPAPAPARPAARPASTKAAPPAPQQSSVPAPQQPSSSRGMLSSIGSTIAQGMAFGTGSAIAHRAVGAASDSMFGGGSSNQAAAPEYAQGAMEQSVTSTVDSGLCATDKRMYYDCIKDNRDDQAVCQFLLDQLKSCQQNNQMYSG
ncbi:hypothetical protein ACA910_018616 [Epithemia clementina (nom. ined.)]